VTATPKSIKSTANNIFYPDRTIARADRALRCSPFCLALFIKMRGESVSLLKIAGDAGLKSGYTRRPIAESGAESSLVWLIQVGMLRREVDGQGLTDSFRLTPLGLQLVEKWEAAGNELSPPTILDRVTNWLTRWFRLGN
jgi:hypothetical protein